tara:strand:+ start:243 stop:368 length:126 start_codon:yes stop_codon:yes gene_type:complete
MEIIFILLAPQNADQNQAENWVKMKELSETTDGVQTYFMNP